MGSHFLLQGVFPTQGSNLGLPHCRQILSHGATRGDPHIGELPQKRKGVNEFSSGPIETTVRFHLNIKITFLTIQVIETRNIWLWGW